MSLPSGAQEIQIRQSTVVPVGWVTNTPISPSTPPVEVPNLPQFDLTDAKEDAATWTYETEAQVVEDRGLPGGQPEPAPSGTLEPEFLDGVQPRDGQSGGQNVPPNLRFDRMPSEKDLTEAEQALEFLGVAPTAPSVGESFLEIPDSGWSPPDGGLAAGPRYLVAVTNGAVAYLTKDGERVFHTSLGAFFGDGTAFDPRVLYDQSSGRFIAVVVTGPRDPANSQIIVAISSSDNPRDGWCFYPVPGENPAGTWADYPTLGVNGDAVFFGANQFDVAGTYQANRMMWLDKGPMLTCANTTRWTVVGLKLADGSEAFTVQPAHSYGTTDEFLAATDGVELNQVRVWRVNDPVGAPTVGAPVDVPVASFNVPPDAPQPPDANTPTGGVPLDTGDVRLLNLITRNESLWMSHASAGLTCGTGSCSVLRYKQFDVSAFPTISVVQDASFGATNYFYMYPAIAVNSRNDLAVSFTRTSEPNGEFPSVRQTGRLDSDPLGTLQGSVQLAGGTANYQELDGVGRNRWGDYFGASDDTCLNRGMWVDAQYSTSTTTWNKWAANVFSQSAPGANNTCLPGLSMPAFPFSTTQDTTFATFEEQDLVQSCGSSSSPGNNSSVWYYFSASLDGTVTVETAGSNYDTVLSAYSETAACSGLSQVACDDDGGPGTQSAISFPVNGGTVYDVLVTEFGNPSCNTQALVLNADYTCSGSVLNLHDYTVGSGAVLVCVATNSITVGSLIQVDDGGDLRVTAPETSFSPPVSIKLGGTFGAGPGTP